MKHIADSYFRILEQVVFADDSELVELNLSEAFDLGRSLMEEMTPPDEVIQIHHDAIVRLAAMYPDLPFAKVAERITKPFMEMSMAYGMAFREQMERRYQAMIISRLEQSRLEAVGTLAAGIAHDFNNILGSIVGFAELAGDELEVGSTGQGHIDQVLIAGFRARDIVNRLLTFARQSPTNLIEVDVVSQVKETLSLLSVSCKPDMEIHFKSDLDNALILANPGQLQQVVMNLCINAADAMNHKGHLFVSLEFCNLASREHETCTNAVCLTVKDSGHGIPPDVQDRMFLPFFTTKAPNKGSGLGLSVVHGIVTQLGGNITVQSRYETDNPGTEFKIFLPLADKFTLTLNRDAQ
ncbi:ATP-binding protein [Methylicorpusculum sp.]|uniref:ATP-binding protein n=1 Tax=Methylicorpusculum sp. TaxID=2713644 RepID=UPI0027228EB8|nr:ATP-binding protein [Methylicorpusculum sp.]MDO8844838.1 ATP-binding protein [Methylicorpusculum sp.]